MEEDMKVVSKVSQTRKSSMSSIPNTFAFIFIRNWLVDKKHEKQRENKKRDKKTMYTCGVQKSSLC